MRILALNFFPAFHPPRSGGEQRYYYFYRHLSEWYDVTLLSPTYSGALAETVEHSTTFREHRIPKDAHFDRLHWTLGSLGIGPECSGYVVALAGALSTAFGRMLDRLVREVDVVVHESPFTLPYDRSIATDGKPRIYNAYNIEHRLAAQFFQGEAGRKAIDFIRFLEHQLVHQSRHLLATSADEAAQFVSDFALDIGKISLAPNGFEPNFETCEQDASAERGHDAVFMGSAHPPNVEAARFIVDRIAPNMPATRFKILGSVCQQLSERVPGNVDLLGYVDDIDKRKLLRTCGVALNPLFSGAGTNLKMLDYMAAAAPIVTTPIGARGLDLSNDLDAFIATGDEIESAIKSVLNDRHRASRVGAAAREKAYAKYTWSHIAEDCRSTFEACMATSGPRFHHARNPGLLVVNDFSVLNPAGGGQVRIYELLTELGRTYDVTLLCLSHKTQAYERALASNVVEVGIPKTAPHRDAEVQAARGETVSIGDVLAGEFVCDNAEFIATFTRLARESVAVIFEHPFLARLLDVTPDSVPIVYSSLNFEQGHKRELLSSRLDAAKRIEQVIDLETKMLNRADLVVCVSESDRDSFRRIFPDQTYVIVENGTRITSTDDPLRADVPIGAHCTPLALFMGSSHMPNVHAARFLIEEVAPSVPEIVIGLIGSVCDAVRLLPRPRNVALFGVVSDDEKAMLLRRASIALNPLQSGGGSSLKVPDFLAAGLPMLSSDIGVRGYALVNDQHYLRAGSSDFVDRLRALSRDRSLREKLARAGQMFALCHWDWEVLGRRYANALTPLTGVSPRVRVLVTTYRFAIPPPGGAESFLLNVLRNFGRSDALDVDVAACDVGKIVNKWHFSATYSTAETAIDRPDFLSALRYFAVDPPALDDFSDCSRLFHSWMAESREQAQALKDELRQPMLMGGWNFAETHAGKPGRWTSLESCIFVGECADGLRVDGYVPSRTTLTIQSGDSIAGERVIDGTFSLQIDLAGHDGSASLLISSPIVAQEDPRELGAFVSHVAVRRCGEWSSIDLASDFETFMRGQNQERWIESLMKVTSRREASVDGVFVKVRGPHSRALDRWLEGHIGRYDVVIAHGVPFATSTRTTQIASTHGVPVVVLPHFHSEDRYYHWQSFYAMFRAAACVIAAPASSKPMFLDKLPARTVIVRGGGIDLAEFEEARLRSHQNAFLAVHSSLRPFVLVLGRKAAGKNYRMVVAAVDSINRQSHRVDLVIIGPEDDHVPVASPTTHYYGEQPRNVVLGALALSLCLANMSTSESFGIVLLEAWASGRPVIARRNCAAFAELVEHGRNGVLANSVAEVADAVATYLADSALAARHGEAGRSDCQAYAWSRIAHDLENVIVDVAAAHRMRTESGE